jgi:hypothetical protein
MFGHCGNLISNVIKTAELLGVLLEVSKTLYSRGTNSLNLILSMTFDRQVDSPESEIGRRSSFFQL